MTLFTGMTYTYDITKESKLNLRILEDLSFTFVILRNLLALEF